MRALRIMLCAGLLYLIGCNQGTDVSENAQSTTYESMPDSSISDASIVKHNDSVIPVNTGDSTQLVKDKSEIRLCTELLPILPATLANRNLKYKVDSVIIRKGMGRVDLLIDTKMKNSVSQPNRVKMATLKTQFLWNKNKLQVSFLDGDKMLQAKVANAAKIWEEHCGIRFEFGDFKNPDISISFQYEGSWSQHGNFSSQVSPSMNFGWLDSQSSDEEIRSIVLHEFGHALGCIHEHQSPSAGIKWKVDAVYAYYLGLPDNWKIDDVKANIFYKYTANQVNFTRFDPESIMIYAIPAELTTNNYSVEANTELSPLDKSHIASIYPKLNQSISLNRR